MVGKTLLINNQLFAIAAKTKMNAVTIGRYMKVNSGSLFFNRTLEIVATYMLSYGHSEQAEPDVINVRDACLKQISLPIYVAHLKRA